jgi:hypothetical protein
MSLGASFFSLRRYTVRKGIRHDGPGVAWAMDGGSELDRRTAEVAPTDCIVAGSGSMLSRAVVHGSCGSGRAWLTDVVYSVVVSLTNATLDGRGYDAVQGGGPGCQLVRLRFHGMRMKHTGCQRR